jgi:hypothetical protein
MDLSFLSDVGSYITSAKDLFEVIKGISGLIRKNDDAFSPDLKKSLGGSSARIQEASAKLSQVVRHRAVPFILRMGTEFRLPPDITQMEEFVLAVNVWDWTYLFGRKAANVPVGTARYLRKLYCSPEEGHLLRADLKTTCLHLFEKALDEELGTAIYIAGVALTSSAYEQVFDIPLEDLLPRVVIKVDVDGQPLSITDPIAMSYMTQRAVEYVFKAFGEESFQQVGFIFTEPPGPQERHLEGELKTLLG